MDTDIVSLVLKNSPFIDVTSRELVEQIEAKKKCKSKLPTWFNARDIYYPNKLNIEQTSSEITALYKSSLIKGASIIDLTGGFGVDCFYFSKLFDLVTHCEIDSTLSEIVKYNYKVLNINNIDCLNTDGIDYLRSSFLKYDWIFIDPSRRHDSKGKVFFLNDCLPNVPKNIDVLFSHSNNIMIKTSPLLDLSKGIEELNYTKKIHVVAVNNEVKELIWILEKKYKGDIVIQTINIKKNNEDEKFEFSKRSESNAKANISEPLSYLYEPNAAIMKSGGFNSICKQLEVFKIHIHSHLYTSSSLLKFPGRTFKIDKIVPYNKKLIKQESLYKANISTRNFPETVQQIQSKHNIKDGGDKYLFFTTNSSNSKVVLICTKAI